ncbi:hypothetical protein EG68_07287 [Paragonimus skrjabini miyazakii]|uniref:1-phosphatidylinositol 4-kinase n=1 Tax=Paragonimus skrjabini miyazakii TaxID=59628 RepID=A0A8S9YTI5_9TREM|nr:hypothetical protein EG68_07287 [Paragonimus skrjabini miyazakii]
MRLPMDSRKLLLTSAGGYVDLVTHQNPRISKCKPPNRSATLINTREVIPGRWSSTDSAVGLSGNIERSSDNPLNHQTESTSGPSASSVANGHGGNPHLCYSTGLPRCGLNTDKALGSTGCVNKVINKGILLSPSSKVCLRSSRSLQRLHPTDPIHFHLPLSSSTDNIHTSLKLSEYAGGTPEVSSRIDHELPAARAVTTPSKSPPDSGLHLVIPESQLSASDDRLTEHRSPRSETVNSPPDPILSLQLQLVPRLVPEWDFIDGLMRLARRLVPISPKEQRTAFLQAELANLNLHLPARVWLPVNKADHIVLRIPPTAAVCLNSKDKAPYLIYVEVLSCEDPWSVPLPSRPTGNNYRPFGFSSFPTGSNSLNSLSHFPWNSNTSSSTSAASAVAASDALIPVNLRIRFKMCDWKISSQCSSHESDPEDPSAAVLKEPWHMKCQRIRELSPWGGLPGWRFTAAIVKVGDDLRQEQLAYQLLTVLQRIWQFERVPLWLRPLTVIVTSPDSGLIEPVPDTVSLHQIKRHARLSLLDYMLREHGSPNSEAFLTAQRNFVESCAAYCIVSYLLQVKDRHNGNILLDNEGHMIHIDYGFMLSASPGKNLGFETSPFKLTAEQVTVMGGNTSDLFEYFKCLLLRGLLAARKHMEEVCVLVELARATCPQLPCFARSGGSTAVSGLRQRFQLYRTEEHMRQSVDRMIEASLNSVTTKLYDSFQYYTNGIQ